MVNLIKDSWIPVITGYMRSVTISPSELVNREGECDILRLDACRADFNGTLIQFLIGLAQTQIAPSDPVEWRKMLFNPPGCRELETSFSQIAPYFEMTGDSCFMQDMTLSADNPVPIGRLLLEMPGENAEKNNTDIFYKRGTVGTICLACAAMALYTLQTSASFGGAGHRNGLRGGGPLTTVIEGKNLWETVWLNVLENDIFLERGNSEKDTPADKFPWLGDLKPASKTETCTPATVHPAQMFFAVPRRIRLLPVKVPDATCDLCGMEQCTTVVKSYATERGGISYKGGWRHTLSPYYTDNKTGELLAVHAKPGAMAYNNLSGILFENPDSGAFPAITVQKFVHSRYEEILNELGEMVPIWVSGYDMDRAKARCYYDHHIPTLHVKPEILEDYTTFIRQLIRTAEFALFIIVRCIRGSQHDENTRAGGDLNSIKSRFWHDTEPDFYRVLSSAMPLVSDYDKTVPLREEWIKILSREGMRLFDQYSQSDMIGYANPRRIALARKDCRLSLSGANKRVRDLLGLPKPEPEYTNELLPAAALEES